MSILKLLGFVIGTTVLLQLVSNSDSTGSTKALVIRITACGLITLVAIHQFAPIYTTIKTLSKSASINVKFLNLILKSIGIAYATDIGCTICEDSGENALATRIRFASNILIISNTLPILNNLLESIQSILK